VARTLTDAIRDIQSKARALRGVRSAPDFPPGGSPRGIFAVAWARDTLINRETKTDTWLRATIICMILKPFKSMADDVEDMVGYAELFASTVVEDLDLGGTVDAVDPENAGIRGRFDVFSYNDVPHIGWRFEVDIEIYDI